MRKRIYEIIEVSHENDKASKVYDITMLCLIIISIVPLAFKETNIVFQWTDSITTLVFIIDYLLRWSTADYKLDKKGIVPFLIYPFTIWAIIDLVSILPALTLMSDTFKLLRLFRIFKTFKVFKALRYSKSIMIIVDVIKKTKNSLLAVCLFAIGYIITSALVIFNFEPETFDTFFDAIYWACVSLTTVGYGDIYPVTTVGRIITMISSLIGVAIVALPAGIITAGFLDGINEQKNKEKNKEE